MLTKFTTKALILSLLYAIQSMALQGQATIRAYQQIYSDNLKGGTTVIGNTGMHILNNNSTVNLTQMNEIGNAANGIGGVGFTQYGNDNSNMQFIDIDGLAETYSSSSADLLLPAGLNTIKFARLYWGGRINNTAITAVPDTLRKIKIRKGNSVYSNILSPVSSVDQFAVTATETIYQCYADITSYVQAAGVGTYTIGNIPATPGAVSGGGKYAGWCIVVVYENPSRPLNSIRLYDGYYQVYTNTSGPASISVTMNNLNVPNNTLLSEDAVVSAMAWEGDGNLGATASNPSGDFVKVNGNVISNTVNTTVNYWNGSISKNGVYVTTKNPSYNNQMGIDIDEVNVGTGYGILPNATSVTVEFGTEADQYFPSFFGFTIRMKDPLVNLDKTVADASASNTIEPNEVLTYTLSGTNQGAGMAYNVFVIDSLPGNTSYVPGSMEVITAPGVVLGPQTDANDVTDMSYKGINNGKHFVKFFIGNNATNNSGGELESGEGYTVKFKVKGMAIPASVSNTATAYSHTIVNDIFTDDGTAVIGPSGGPTPVKLTRFSVKLSGVNADLLWVTDFEINSDHYEIERSWDALAFEKVGEIKGKGNSAVKQTYNFADVNIGALQRKGNIVYYRLRIVDTDGKNSHSQVIALRLNGTMAIGAYTIYPNPFMDDIKIMITGAQATMADFRIIAINGKEQLKRKIKLENGDNIVVLRDLQQLANGTYILEINTGENKYSSKIVKKK